MTSSQLFALILPALLLPAAAWGRDDLCVFRKGLFLCDTAHDGGTAEMRFRFGKAGDIPFLVRPSSGAPAVPCVFRGQGFLCSPGIELLLTVPVGAQPLAGDVDGDLPDGGTVDPCYRLGKRWTCKVFEEPIGFRLVTSTFGSGKGAGLLGDFDGDALPVFCMYQAWRFFCQGYDAHALRVVQAFNGPRHEIRDRSGGSQQE